jgi:type II secretory pathway pseudopilin PulG
MEGVVMKGVRRIGAWLLFGLAGVIWFFAILALIAGLQTSGVVTAVVLFLVVAVLGVLVFIMGRLVMHPESAEKKSARKDAQRQAREQLRSALSAGRAGPTTGPSRRGRMRSGEWTPPDPRPFPTDPWGPAVTEVEVVGESHHKDSARKLIAGDPDYDPEFGLTIYDPAVLVSDGSNPFSANGNAVAVFVRGLHVWYLPEAVSKTWAPHLKQLNGAGQDLRVKSRLWAKDDDRGIGMRVTVTLPTVENLAPSNGLPSEPHVIIPAGRKRQVTKEEDHLDVLSKLLVPGQGNHVAAVLRAITDVRARSAPEVVQVEIDGHRVGILTDTQSKNMLPLVKYIEARGKIAVCRAEVQGTAIKADVVLYCADAGEVGPAWLEALGPETPKPTEVIPGPDWDWDDDVSASPTALKHQNSTSDLQYRRPLRRRGGRTD